MAFLEEVAERIFPGTLIVLGAAVLAPVLIPAAGGVVRPLVKTVVRGGMYVGDKIYEVASEAGEQFSDMVAEIRSEKEQSPSAHAKATARRPARAK
jgi:hypothetical protein